MIIKCPRWRPSDEFFLGKCSIGEKKGKPSFGHCVNNCKKCTNTIQELNDYIKTLAKMPTKTVQVKNATKALGRAIKNGFRFVSLLARDKRFRICNKCPHLSDKLLLRCSKCGCSLKLKTRLESESCPIGKW